MRDSYKLGTNKRLAIDRAQHLTISVVTVTNIETMGRRVSGNATAQQPLIVDNVVSLGRH